MDLFISFTSFFVVLFRLRGVNTCSSAQACRTFRCTQNQQFCSESPQRLGSWESPLKLIFSDVVAFAWTHPDTILIVFLLWFPQWSPMILNDPWLSYLPSSASLFSRTLLIMFVTWGKECRFRPFRRRVLEYLIGLSEGKRVSDA